MPEKGKADWKGAGAGASAGASGGAVLGAAMGGPAAPAAATAGAVIGGVFGGVYGLAGGSLDPAKGIEDAVTLHGGEWVLDNPVAAGKENGDRPYPRDAAYVDLFARNPELCVQDHKLFFRQPKAGDYAHPAGVYYAVDVYTLVPLGPEWDANGTDPAFLARTGKGPYAWWRWNDWGSVGYPLLSSLRQAVTKGVADAGGDSSGWMFNPDDLPGGKNKPGPQTLSPQAVGKFRAANPRGWADAMKGKKFDSAEPSSPWLAALLLAAALGGVWYVAKRRKAARHA